MNEIHFREVFVTIVIFVQYSIAIQRRYYVAVEEVEWDYAPRGNLLRANNKASSFVYLDNNQSIPLIGSKYTKAIYREYTDDTFTTLKEHPPWMGIVGVFIKAEVGDHVVVNFYNKAKSNNFTMHPHGVFYDKNTEGAFYVDGTSGKDKLDDGVPPGEKYTYVWIVHPDYGPTPEDPNCITWLVHSHQLAEEEVMTGAIGMMATCKKGTLDNSGNRKDVDREYAILLMIFDEGFSLYYDENIAKYIPDVSPDTIADNLPYLQEGNRKYSINGYIYGNLQGLEAEEGETISWHICVVGTDPGLHTFYVQGHSMVIYHHRMDTVGVYPGDSLTAIMVADNPGKWLLSSQSPFQIRAGMQAFFEVKPSTDKQKRKHRNQDIEKTLEYFIAAEEVWWDYAPTKTDVITGIPLSQHPVANVSFGDPNKGLCKLNGKYKKAVFRGYTSRHFDNRTEQPEHFGFLGPLITAEVGDTVNVMFYNNSTRNYSIQAYLFFVAEDENGILYDNGPNVAVPPNGRKTYTWRVPESRGPTDYDPDCLYGRYYSAVNIVQDTYSGLTGPLLICRKGTLHGPNKRDIDRDFFLSFSNVIETYSHYIKDSIDEGCPNADYADLMMSEEFIMANIMNSLNGRVFGNLNGLTMCKGDKVNWHMTVIGNGMDDLHTPHFHGNTFLVNGARKDTMSLNPDKFDTAYMIPDNVGNWSLEDQVVPFLYPTATMEFLYEVKNCQNKSDHNETENQTEPLATKVREYFIAAVEREWDYAPMNVHPFTGEKLSENNITQTYYVHDVTRNMIGNKFIKALYREFTDASFQTEKQRRADEVHLGMLGPFIKAEVGDKLRVTFKNNCSFNYSIMPHGLLYNKANEGYPYEDGIPLEQKPGDVVQPGETYVYEWLVPERAGPGPKDFNCITWAYMSHVNYAVDIMDGLIGPLVVCRPGILDDQGRRTDVDREWALMFFITMELQSNYFNQNIKTYLKKDPKNVTFDILDYNVRLNINGFIFGNVPNVTMYQGETAGIYIISLGGVTGIHTVHFHGNTFITRRRDTSDHRHDVEDVLPGDFDTVQLTGINKGTWLVHCHVNNHSQVGMEMVYHVIDPNDVYIPRLIQ